MLEKKSHEKLFVNLQNKRLPWNGRGLYDEYFENKIQLENKVNELNLAHKDLFEIIFACEIRSEIKFKPVELVAKFEIDE